MKADDCGNYTEEFLPANSAWAREICERGRKKHYITSLIELDITEMRKAVKAFRSRTGKSISFFSCMVKCIADTIDEYKEVQACRYKKNRKITFDEIDISIPVERLVDGRKMPMPYVLRKANNKSALQIHEELSEAKYRIISDKEQVLSNPASSIWIRIFPFLPRFIRNLFWNKLERNPFIIKHLTGTVGITSTTAAGIKGWGIPISIQPVCLALGGVTKTETIRNGSREHREFLALTIMFDHDTIDGAPASRFVSRLNKNVKRTDCLDRLY